MCNGGIAAFHLGPWAVQYSTTGSLRTESEANRRAAQIRRKATGRIFLAQDLGRRVKSDTGRSVQSGLRRRQREKMCDRANRAMLRVSGRACRIAVRYGHLFDAESGTNIGEITALGCSRIDYGWQQSLQQERKYRDPDPAFQMAVQVPIHHVNFTNRSAVAVRMEPLLLVIIPLFSTVFPLHLLKKQQAQSMLAFLKRTAFVFFLNDSRAQHISGSHRLRHTGLLWLDYHEVSRMIDKSLSKRAEEYQKMQRCIQKVVL
jgi:hypothetical protein